jgi:hypothetical protein
MSVFVSSANALVRAARLHSLFPGLVGRRKLGG